MGELRALTVRQPWAWAIATQGKNIENRTWKTPYRGLVAIHAGKSGEDMDAVLPVDQADRRFRAIYAKVKLSRAMTPEAVHLLCGRVVAVAELRGCHEEEYGGVRCGPWAIPGQWHWNLFDARPLSEPVPCKGALGLWRLPDDVEKAVRAQLGEGCDGR